MLNNVKLSFYYSRKRKNGQGRAPIYYKVTINGDEIVRSTGIYVLPEHWNRKNKKVIGGVSGCEFADEYNALLVKIERDVLYKKISAEQDKAILYPEDFLRKKRKGFVIPTILEAAITWNETQGQEHGGHAISTAKSYQKRLKKLQQFLADKGLSKAKVTFATVQLATEFKKWLLDKGYAPEYAKKCLHLLKHAEKQGVISGHLAAKNMDIVTFKGGKRKRTEYLDPEELNEIIKLASSPGLAAISKRFLFQCNTGYAYCDHLQVQPSWKREFQGINCLVDERQKSDEISIIPLFTAAEEILDDWGWSVPYISNQEYNRQLKLLAKVAGIEKRLTTHVARHTFGMIMLNDGYSLETVSRMMGHGSIRITERIYARILPKRILSETKSLNMDVSYAVAA